MSPTHQDLSNDTTFSQIKSRVPVPLITYLGVLVYYKAGQKLLMMRTVKIDRYFFSLLGRKILPGVGGPGSGKVGAGKRLCCKIWWGTPGLARLKALGYTDC